MSASHNKAFDFSRGLFTALLRHLQRPTRHWGDIDPGGWRIPATLQQSIPELTPLAKDAAWLARFHGCAQTLSRKEQEEVRAGTTLPPQLRKAMLQYGKLEQEALPLDAILNEIHEWLHTLP